MQIGTCAVALNVTKSVHSLVVNIKHNKKVEEIIRCFTL